MSYRLVDKSTIRVPQYVTQTVLDDKGRFTERSTKEPAGTTKEVTHSLWKCTKCKAWYCSTSDSAPEECGNKLCPGPVDPTRKR